MADYPSTLGQEVKSKEPWRDPIISSFSRAGGFKGQRLQPTKKRTFIVEHRQLTAAEKASFEAFYDTNRNLAINFWWADAPGTIYVAALVGELDWVRSKSTLWDVTVTLVEI
jgi:hypothetical protein